MGKPCADRVQTVRIFSRCLKNHGQTCRTCPKETRAKSLTSSRRTNETVRPRCTWAERATLLTSSRRESKKSCPVQVSAKGSITKAADLNRPLGLPRALNHEARVSVPRTPQPVSSAWPQRRAFLILSGQAEAPQTVPCRFMFHYIARPPCRAPNACQCLYRFSCHGIVPCRYALARSASPPCLSWLAFWSCPRPRVD